ncbi:hypothetical protein DRJ22_01845, partial [Candidatus Woesearchaeota archaeon]
MKKDLIKQIEKFEEELAKETYSHYAGLKDTLDVSKIYNKYKFLFTKENIKKTKKEYNKTKTRKN